MSVVKNKRRQCIELPNPNHGAGVGHALASGDLYNGRKTVLVADPRKWKPLRRFCSAFVHGSERRM